MALQRFFSLLLSSGVKDATKLIVFATIIYCQNIPMAFAISNDDCNANGSYSLGFHVNIKNSSILSSAAVGSVLGTVDFNETQITCNQKLTANWYIQIEPHAQSAGTSTLCKTNIRGIGIQYVNMYNNPIACDRWDEIVKVNKGQNSAAIPRGTVLAKLIRLNEPLPSNGGYQLTLGEAISFVSYYPGLTNSTAWGKVSELAASSVNIVNFNPMIFFPAFSTSTPSIDLNLTHRPGSPANATASGQANIELCLYDGNNSLSNRITLLFQDEGAGSPGRAGRLFSVYRENADRSQTANRLDYQVSITNPTTGAMQNVVNGQELIWSDTNRRNIQKQVVLPGVPGVSLCVPTTLFLTTPTFQIADKAAGRYRGKLKVIYSPSTQTGNMTLP